MNYEDILSKETTFEIVPHISEELYELAAQRVKQYDTLFPNFFNAAHDFLEELSGYPYEIDAYSIDSYQPVFYVVEEGVYTDPVYFLAHTIESFYLDIMCRINIEAVYHFDYYDLYILEHVVFRTFTYCMQNIQYNKRFKLIKSSDEIKKLNLSFETFTGIDCLANISDWFFIRTIYTTDTDSGRIWEVHNSSQQLEEGISREERDRIIGSETETINAIVNIENVDEKVSTIEKHIKLLEDINRNVNKRKSKVPPKNPFQDVKLNEKYKMLMPLSFNLSMILFHRYRFKKDKEDLDALVFVVGSAILNNLRKRKYSNWDLNIWKSDFDNSYVIFQYLMDGELRVYNTKTSDCCVSAVYLLSEKIDEYFNTFHNHIGYNKLNEVAKAEFIARDPEDRFELLKKKRDSTILLRLKKKLLTAFYNVCDLNQMSFYENEIEKCEAEIREVLIREEAEYVLLDIVKTIDFIYLLTLTIPFVIDLTNDEDEKEKLEDICSRLEDIEREFRREVYSRDSILKKYRKQTALNLDVIRDAEAEYYRGEVQKEKNRTELIKFHVLQSLDALKDSDVNTIVANRLGYMKNYDFNEEDYEFLDSVSVRISEAIKKKVSGEQLFQKLKSSLYLELNTYGQKISVNVLETLVTAEYLYSLYIKGKTPEEGFDYSCISALYYQAFEALYNDLIIRPYLARVKMEMGVDPFIIRMGEKPWLRKKEKAAGYGFFPEKRISAFVDHAGFKNECMIGNFVYLLQQTVNEKGAAEVKYFSKFLDDIFAPGWRKSIKGFADAVDVAREHRNAASHGGTIISYSMAHKDKERVIIVEEFEKANLYKNLVKQMLSYFKH